MKGILPSLTGVMLCATYSYREAIASLLPGGWVSLNQDAAAQRKAIGKGPPVRHTPPRLRSIVTAPLARLEMGPSHPT